MIPITICHGLSRNTKYPLYPESPLTKERMEEYFNITHKYGLHSITYNDLDALMKNNNLLPNGSIMFDFDHPARSIRYDIYPIMERYGFKGNIFINTEPMEEAHSGKPKNYDTINIMTWEEIGELVDAGWVIGSHTHSHPNLSELSAHDPSGHLTEYEMEKSDEIIKSRLGIVVKDFAFTGNSWSTIAENAAKKRYRFSRLWITGDLYQADGKSLRYADLINSPEKDEADGGPPYNVRYITEKTDPYKLPAMELQKLIYEYQEYKRYLEGSTLQNEEY
jgi:peptidoglycan/xylan/chitin deacetylase (PgdA/CDA1 family)